jgi:pyrroloquinoline-quinone synthase
MRDAAAQAHLGQTLIAEIKDLIDESGINTNDFYMTFRKEPLDPSTLKHVFQQYYYYIRTFPQILAGLSARVDSELIRMKLARTVVSELGDNGEGKPHFQMFEDVLAGVGVALDDWTTVDHIPEVQHLVAGLRNLFLERPTNYALGAHYVIEEFGFPMIVNLYEGFRLYKGWKHADLMYFYLHLLVEANHVDWIGDAVLEAATTPNDAADIRAGAEEVLVLLKKFWAGLNRLALIDDRHGADRR